MGSPFPYKATLSVSGESFSITVWNVSGNMKPVPGFARTHDGQSKLHKSDGSTAICLNLRVYAWGSRVKVLSFKLIEKGGLAVALPLLRSSTNLFVESSSRRNGASRKHPHQMEHGMFLREILGYPKFQSGELEKRGVLDTVVSKGFPKLLC